MIFRLLTLLIVVSLASGCTGLNPMAVGSVDSASPESGVGGTGFTDVPGADRDLDEGVGGTGYATGVAQQLGGDDEGVGGTGIFGIITAFGSIVVNGVHIDYEDETPVVVDGVAGTPDDFAIGQVVAVEAQPVGERYQAQLVEVRHTVLGPVSSVDDATRAITVLGQTIQVAESDRLPLTDEWVRVSGLRSPDDSVIATRIDPVAPSRGAFVRGVVLPAEGDALALGGLMFERPLLDGRTINAGEEVLLRGVVQPRGFEITDFVKAPREPFGGRMSDLIVQGFIASNLEGQPHVAGHNWTLPAGVASDFDDKGRPATVFRGRWLEGEISVSPQPHIQTPGLLRPLPWALNGDQLTAGELPDLLRGRMEAQGLTPMTIDPTTLPNVTQVKALLSAKGVPLGFFDAARPLTGDQLSVLMELGGVDATETSIQRFNPDRLVTFLEHRDEIRDFITSAEFEQSELPPLIAIRQRLETLGIDPAELAGVRYDLAAIGGLLRLRHAINQEGFDPSKLPTGVRGRLREFMMERPDLLDRVPAHLRPSFVPVTPGAPRP